MGRRYGKCYREGIKMCLAVPVQIIEVLPGDEAIAEIQKIDPEEAQKTIQLFNSQVSA